MRSELRDRWKRWGLSLGLGVGLFLLLLALILVSAGFAASKFIYVDF
jgi:hypothetical protein